MVSRALGILSPKPQEAVRLVNDFCRYETVLLDTVAAAVVSKPWFGDSTLNPKARNPKPQNLNKHQPLNPINREKRCAAPAALIGFRFQGRVQGLGFGLRVWV